MKFGTVLCNASENDSFEREVWRSMQPYILQIASDRHSYGCHILFENFSVKFIDIIRNIIEQEEISWIPVNEEDATTYERCIVWGRSTRTYISDRIIKIKKLDCTNFTICIEKITKERLEELRKKNSYIS